MKSTKTTFLMLMLMLGISTAFAQEITWTFDVDYKGTITAMGKTRAGFKVTGTINRFDYNINWDKSFGQGLIVGKKVDIICNVELVK